MGKAKPDTTTRARSAITGEYVSKETAKKDPKHTVVETDKKRK